MFRLLAGNRPALLLSPRAGVVGGQCGGAGGGVASGASDASGRAVVGTRQPAIDLTSRQEPAALA